MLGSVSLPNLVCTTVVLTRATRNLAANVGIDFKTPEEYFLHEAVLPFTRDFEPSRHLNPASTTSLDASPLVIEKKNPLDIVMFCGSPASGKSTFYRKHLQPLGYERVNQDTLKSVRSSRPTPCPTNDCASERQMYQGRVGLPA